MRAMVHQCRHLFRQAPTSSASLRAQKAKVSLEKRQPHKATGRHAFLAWLMQEVKLGRPNPQQHMPANLRQEVMKQHSGLYSSLTPKEKLHWEEVARLTSMKKQAEADTELDHQLAVLRLDAMRQEQERLAEGKTHKHGHLSFTDEDWQVLLELWNSADFSKARVQELRVSAATAPQEPPDPVKQAFRNIAVVADEATPEPSAPWLGELCKQRDRLPFTMLLTDLEEGSPVYYFLFAVQKPYRAWFLQAAVCHRVLRSTTDLSVEAHLEEWQNWNEHEFVICEPPTFLNDLALPAETSELYVLEDVTVGWQGQLEASGDPVSLARFLQIHSGQGRKEGHGSRTKAPKLSKDDPLIAQHPWLGDYLRHGEPRHLHGSTQRPAAASSSAANPACADEDLDFQQVWDDLAERRRLWSLEAPKVSEDFVTHIRGGTWTAKHRGVTADCVVAQATGRLAMEWCRKYGLNRMASFSFAKYGESTANHMALQWCRRLQHYFDLWLQSDEAVFEYSSAALESYDPGQEWTSLLATLPSKGPARLRAEGIDSLCPQSTGQASAASA